MNRVFTITSFLVLFSLVTGCAAPVYKTSFDESGDIPEDVSLVVLTHGRKDGGVFLSYDVVHVDESGRLKKDRFLQAEVVRLYRPIGDLDSGYYGFMHIFELPPGKYYLVGRRGRGYDSMINAGGIYILQTSSNEVTPVALEFELQAGKLNYLGEIVTYGKPLTFDEPLTNDNVTLKNRWDRDVKTATKMIPGINNFDVVYSEPKKIDITKMNVNVEQ